MVKRNTISDIYMISRGRKVRLKCVNKKRTKKERNGNEKGVKIRESTFAP